MLRFWIVMICMQKNALYEIVKKLNEDHTLDFIYSDEDKLSEDGTKRRNPFFKPDWSPDTFMSLMYTCHLAVYRKSLLDELGGLRVGLEGSQDYDLVLRVMEKTNRIGHVPKSFIIGGNVKSLRQMIYRQSHILLKRQRRRSSKPWSEEALKGIWNILKI